jgi:hypothetical protein
MPLAVDTTIRKSASAEHAEDGVADVPMSRGACNTVPHTKK